MPELDAQQRPDIWVNAVELDAGRGLAPLQLDLRPRHQYDGPDGVWDCTDRSYDQLSAAVAGGVLYAQSTQATHEVQKFPDGAAVRIPPYSRIIGDVHLLNASQRSAGTAHASSTLYSIADDVTVKLAPFHMTYHGLDIPPHSTPRFTGECDLTSALHDDAGNAYAPKLYYLLPTPTRWGRASS